VQEVAHPEANIIFGAVIDDALGDEARVTVIAAGFDQVDVTSQPASAKPAEAPQSSPAAAAAAAGAGNSAWAQRPQTVPADAGFDVDLPAVVEPDLSAGRQDDLDVPDFLK